MIKLNLGLIFASIALSPSLVLAEDAKIPPVAYPKLALHAKDAEGFVPKGWKLDHQQSGDLNGDGINDLLFVLVDDDPKNIIADPMGGDKPINTNPYILAVAFADKAAHDYKLVLENHALIPRPTQELFDDIYSKDETKVAHGSFKVGLFWFASTIHQPTLQFKYQHNKFELIGYEVVDTHRGTGEVISKSVNYLSRKMEIKSGTISDDTTKSTFKKLKPAQLINIDQIVDGLEFEPKIGR